ncbi:MAG TPA: TlyA family RNA methyltransferase [Myxococcaceae bacterium]|nr:TlyA family RNA methyltransferase [Myxococcaceae bacterium]
MRVGKKERLDVLLVASGLAPTRARAQALVLAGQVVVGDQRVDKPGTRVPVDAALRLKGEALPFVSRGGLKLRHALDHFRLDVRGAVCVDVGASTGGFTDCLLQAGAARVHALDVGYGQLHPRLRADPRVVVHERVNARHLERAALGEAVDVAVVDVSFISLGLVLPAVLPLLGPEGLLVALIKPQFEVGRSSVGKGGVVRDEAARAAAIERVRQEVEGHGLHVLGVSDSPVLGPAGNREALLAARRVVTSPGRRSPPAGSARGRGR